LVTLKGSEKMKKTWKVLIALCIVAAVTLTLLPMPTMAIQNGTPDGQNHPYVVMCVFDINGVPAWRTTGVLISPTVVLTAGHGTYGTTGARVSNLTYIPSGYEGYPYPGKWAIEAKAIYTNPMYKATPTPGLPGFDAYDIGIIVLSKPIRLSGGYASLPAASYVDSLRMKPALDLVGYGVTSQSKGGGVSPYDSWTWDRYRNYAASELLQAEDAIAAMFLKLTANPGQDKGGTTFGDSGGPILKGGTNILFGLNSFVNNSNCDGVTYAQRVDRADILAWINGYLR
jgi:hypothetical protein